MPKQLIKLGKEYLKEIEKKMKASGTAASKLKYKPKPVPKKKKKKKKAHNLPLIRIPSKK